MITVKSAWVNILQFLECCIIIQMMPFNGIMNVNYDQKSVLKLSFSRKKRLNLFLKDLFLVYRILSFSKSKHQVWAIRQKWGSGGRCKPYNFFNTFWIARTCFAFNIFCFIQCIVLVNTSLTSVEAYLLIFFIFHLIC